MMTKQELYDSLKNDGAKIQRALNFVNRDELVEMYKERFGIDPDVPFENEKPQDENTEQQNTEPPKENEKPKDFEKIPLLKFTESGWCDKLNRAYIRGLYRPADQKEYLALKDFASEEMFV